MFDRAELKTFMTFNSRFGTLVRYADSDILVSLNRWVSYLNPTYLTFSLTIKVRSGYYGASIRTLAPSNSIPWGQIPLNDGSTVEQPD